MASERPVTESSPRWTEGFQRAVIASAIRAELLSRVGASFQSRLFGPPTGPRGRIGHDVATYWERFRSAPADGEIDEFLARERMSDAERVVVRDEWAQIQAVPVPNDLKYAEEQIQDWVSRQAIMQTLL